MNHNQTIKTDTITTGLPSYTELPFYHKQVRIALKNCGIIDPKNVGEYIARDGYAALSKTLSELTPDDVITTIKDSGLRGRGGAGFSTGIKWEFARRSRATPKYIICNADEGDPGAFMDRSILEGDPHCIIEGMTIAGYAIGANQGYIYCRAEYPLAIAHLKNAIAQAEELGLLGDNILGTDFWEQEPLFVEKKLRSWLLSREGGENHDRAHPSQQSRGSGISPRMSIMLKVTP
jgi:NADH-quinone oxidoreductase subunit F